MIGWKTKIIYGAILAIGFAGVFHIIIPFLPFSNGDDLGYFFGIFLIGALLIFLAEGIKNEKQWLYPIPFLIFGVILFNLFQIYQEEITHIYKKFEFMGIISFIILLLLHVLNFRNFFRKI